jgi:hypothetical protein
LRCKACFRATKSLFCTSGSSPSCHGKSWKPPRKLVTGDAEHPKLDYKNISNFDERGLTMAKVLIEVHPRAKNGTEDFWLCHCLPLQYIKGIDAPHPQQ